MTRVQAQAERARSFPSDLLIQNAGLDKGPPLFP